MLDERTDRRDTLGTPVPTLNKWNKNHRPWTPTPPRDTDHLLTYLRPVPEFLWVGLLDSPHHTGFTTQTCGLSGVTTVGSPTRVSSHQVRPRSRRREGKGTIQGTRSGSRPGKTPTYIYIFCVSRENRRFDFYPSRPRPRGPKGSVTWCVHTDAYSPATPGSGEGRDLGSTPPYSP